MICHRESCIEFVDIYLHALKVVASMCYLFVMSDSKMILDVLLHDAMAQRSAVMAGSVAALTRLVAS